MPSDEFHGLRVADLDEIDRRIVRQLQADGRRSVTRIAQEIGLSHAAARQRVQRLIELEIVRIAAITAPGTHGYGMQAFVGVRTDHRVREVASEIDKIPEAYYVVVCSGSIDIMIEMMCRTPEHLLDLVARVRAIDGVIGSETYTFLELTKWRYAPGFGDADAPTAEAAL
jgi:Lrp/AsnC family transcriptional regulator for asnA, asnC and gidA